MSDSHGIAVEIQVANPVTISVGCSICAGGGRLVRGYCLRHYQRWYRNGFVDGNDEKTNLGRTVFTVALWNRWLADFNALPDPIAVGNIEAIRNSIERVVGSARNRRRFGRGGG